MDRVQPQPAASADGRRMSIFTEVGLVDETRIREERSPIRTIGTSLKAMRPAKMLRFRSRNDVIREKKEDEDDDSDWESVCENEDDSISVTMPASTTYAMSSKLYRLGFFSLVLALLLPLLQINPISRIGVRGGAIPRATIEAQPESSMLIKREDTPTDACKRWSGQSTIVNGTLYMYGFRRISDAKQEDNTWSKCLYLPHLNSPSSNVLEISLL